MLLKGSPVAKKWMSELALEASSAAGRKLGILMVGANDASVLYIGKKQAKAVRMGIDTQLVHLREGVTFEDVSEEIARMNEDQMIAGYILQLPLGSNLRERTDELLELIDPRKDLDGLTEKNLLGVTNNEGYFIPATALAVKKLLEHYALDWRGKKVVVVGQGKIAGRPVADLAEKCGAIVTRIESGDTYAPLLEADISIVAIGQPGFFQAEQFKPGSIIIDIGTTPVAGRLVGDVNPSGLEERDIAFTPVPGGVGQLTVLALLANFLTAAKNQY